jgi:D-alanyl-D-alanine carboxypeptidase (penicillin-binding protein 5/6)
VAFAQHFGDRVVGGSCEANAEGNFEAFVDAMNQMAQRLGMSETYYTNTHGLTDEKHLTSVRDLVKLSHAAMLLPEFRLRTSTAQRGCTVTSESGYTRNVLWKNTNRLVRVAGFDGVKTGTTSAAGSCLVSRGQRNGTSLLVVVLGSAASDARYADTKNLFRWGWQQAAEQPR